MWDSNAPRSNRRVVLAEKPQGAVVVEQSVLDRAPSDNCRR
jgi:hypothetical protein